MEEMTGLTELLESVALAAATQVIAELPECAAGANVSAWQYTRVREVVEVEEQGGIREDFYHALNAAKADCRNASQGLPDWYSDLEDAVADMLLQTAIAGYKQGWSDAGTVAKAFEK